MPIETENPEYTECLPKWTLVRKCVAGAQAVRREGTVFLPDPDPYVLDKDVRYNPYRKRAQFLNVTARTRNAMVGMAFRRPPEYDLTGIEYIEENANGSGTNLEQLAKIVVGDLLEVGRIGLLSDYPSAEQGMSKEQISQLGLKATIKLYTAENIINWKTTVINGESVLSLVNLMETYELEHDVYSQETEKQFRVLKLVDGIYTQELYRDDILIESFQPRANGSTLKYIPIVIAGTYSNDPAVDDAALYDIAEINIGHYRNSADYEEGVFLHGQPMLHIDTGNTSAAEFEALNPNGIEVGARRGIATTGGGSAALLQAASNGAAYEAMKMKEEQMVSIGARMIESGGQAETAEAARIKHAGDNSVLTNIVQNASDAIELSLSWVANYMGLTVEPEYKINDDFYDKTINPQMLMAKIQLMDRGVIAPEDVRMTLRKAGEIEREEEDIIGDSEAVSPV
jgi:hypothetical protein